MDINFSCTKCGQHIEIDESGAGLNVDCPLCKTPLVVPELKVPPPIPPPVMPANSSEPQVYVLRDAPPVRDAKSRFEQPATEKQKAYLSQLDIRFDEATLTKSQATLLISQ
jgi:phage FluMu protein Com